MNYAVNLRSLLEFIKPYADTIAESMLHFPDTSGKGSITEFVNLLNGKQLEMLTATLGLLVDKSC